MEPGTVAVAVTALVAGVQASFTLLALVNYRHAARELESERAWVRERLGVADPDRVLAYERATTRVSQVRSWTGVAVLLAVLWSGALGEAVTALRAALPGFAAGLALLVGVAVASRLLAVPFGLYSTFVIEERFGFNEQSPALWLRDTLVGLALTAVLVGAVAGGVLALVGLLPTYWPLAAWLFVAAVALVMQVLLPRVVMPLFYDFDRVEGDLRAAVEEVFDRADVRCDEVYEMNASSRSSHGNAFFSGFGRAKRVVLFDTIVEQMDRAELQAVLAHELAHWTKGHVWRRVAAQVLQYGAVFAALAVLVDYGPLYAAFGVPETAAAGLLLAGVVVSPLLQLAAPVVNLVAHRHEREADDYAADVMGSGQPLADALASLYGENLSNPFPHPAYQVFHDSHPTLPQRLTRLRDRDDERGEGGLESGDAEGGPTA